MSSVIALITAYRLKNKSFLITNVRKKNLAKPLYQVTASVRYNLLTDDVLIHLFVPSHPTKLVTNRILFKIQVGGALKLNLRI